MKPRIFVSAVSRELKTARQLVANTLLALGYDPVWQDIFETSSEDIRPMLRRQIDSCSAVLQIVGDAYGAEPPTADETFGRVSYTQYEALYAKSRGRKVYYLIAQDDMPRDATPATIDVPREDTDAGSADVEERRRLQANYRASVQSTEHIFYPVQSHPEAELSVRRLKQDMDKLRRGFRYWMIATTVLIVFLVAGTVRIVGISNETGSKIHQQQKVLDETSARISATSELAQQTLNLAKQQSKQTENVKTVSKAFAKRFLEKLISNDKLPSSETRRQAISELRNLIPELTPDEIEEVVSKFVVKASQDKIATPLERARAKLIVGDYDGVLAEAKEDKKESFEIAMLAGTAALAKFREDSRPAWSQKAAAEFLQAVAMSDQEIDPITWSYAAVWAAESLHDLARFDEAEKLLRDSLRLREKNLDVNDPGIALVLNNLASLLCDRHSREEAEQLLRRAIVINEHTYGPKHSETVASLSNLAGVMKDADRLPEAEFLLRRALAIDLDLYGLNHDQVSKDLGNLSLLLSDTNRLAEAETLSRHAIATEEKKNGPMSLGVAIDLSNLASLQVEMNRLTLAEPLMLRALAIGEQGYGAEHPIVATYLGNLARLLEDTDRLAEAETLTRRTLAIDEKYYGYDHPNVAFRLNNLGGILLGSERLAEAEPLLRRALEIIEKSSGIDHSDTAITLHSLAMLCDRTQRPAAAERLMRRMLAIFRLFEHRTGRQHSKWQISLLSYRNLLVSQKLPPGEIVERLKTVEAIENPMEPIVPELDELLGAAKTVDEVLTEIDQGYKVYGRPPVFDLPTKEPLAPYLMELLRPNHESLNSAGVSAFFRGEFATAVALYEAALEMLCDEPSEVEYIFTIRMNRAAALRELGEVALSRVELKGLFSNAHDLAQVKASTKGRAHYHLALAEWRLNDHAAAQREAGQSLEAYGDDPDTAQMKEQTEQLLLDLIEQKPQPIIALVDVQPLLEVARRQVRAQIALSILPLEHEAMPLIDQMLGPLKSAKAVLEELELQYGELDKPRVWFLPLDQPISPHLDELLGPPRKPAIAPR